MEVGFRCDSKKYLLLPVWFFNTQFKGKTYEYALNGQTGKMVGQIPLSKIKLFLVMMIPFLIAIFLTLLDVTADLDGDAAGIGWLVVIGLYIFIKLRYRNVKDVLDNPVSYYDLKETHYEEFSKGNYKKRFSKEELGKKEITILNDEKDFEESKKEFEKMLANKVWEED